MTDADRVKYFGFMTRYIPAAAPAIIPPAGPATNPTPNPQAAAAIMPMAPMASPASAEAPFLAARYPMPAQTSPSLTANRFCEPIAKQPHIAIMAIRLFSLLFIALLFLLKID